MLNQVDTGVIMEKMEILSRRYGAILCVVELRRLTVLQKKVLGKCECFNIEKVVSQKYFTFEPLRMTLSIHW